MQFFDIITAVTLTGIIAILAVYLVVVYKKGWLKRNSKASESYFLCPNSKCRKVFRKPIWVTDLSKTPPESYQSCPHCGVGLQTSPSFIPKSPEFKNTPETTSLTKDLKPSERAQDIQKANVPKREEISREFKPTLKTDVPRSLEKATALHQPERLLQVPPKTTEIPKKPEEKKPSVSPRACSHFFGYVRTLPKSTPIPDECMWCPIIVKCLTGVEKIEA